MCCLQKSGLRVMLQLLSMRTEEASQRVLHTLAPAAGALLATSRHLSVWLAALRKASAAAESAQAAHVEAACL